MKQSVTYEMLKDMQLTDLKTMMDEGGVHHPIGGTKKMTRKAVYH